MTTSALVENVRKYRRAAGWSQEDLGLHAGLSTGTIRKLERGGSVKVETLHAIARALGIETSRLMAADASAPVRGEDPNRWNLRDLRIALTPAVGLAGAPSRPVGEEPSLRQLRRATMDGVVLYRSDRYGSIAATLPDLIRRADEAVAYFDDGEEHRRALLARSEILQLAGRYLTQIRQYDIAYTALRNAIQDARAAGDLTVAASGVGGLCWTLLRTGRFDEAERIASEAMDLVEPKIRKAEPRHYVAWGGLAMEAAAAAVRNNRPQEARDYRHAAAVAATAVGRTPENSLSHWPAFGVVMAALKALEDAMIVGDARSVVRRASEEEALSPKAWSRLGRPHPNDGHRFSLDVARAHVRTGDPQAGMDELKRLYDSAPEWLRHQQAAASTMEEILSTRKRTLTGDMREVAAHLGVVG